MTKHKREQFTILFMNILSTTEVLIRMHYILSVAWCNNSLFDICMSRVMLTALFHLSVRDASSYKC